MAEVPERPEASAAGGLQEGDTVVVRRLHLAGHVRTPRYVQGAPGRIERSLGSFPNPEQLAYQHASVEPVPLHRVRFFASDLFPDAGAGSTDTVTLDLYEHWLEVT